METTVSVADLMTLFQVVTNQFLADKSEIHFTTIMHKGVHKDLWLIH
jgi:hypothetical protein